MNSQNEGLPNHAFTSELNQNECSTLPQCLVTIFPVVIYNISGVESEALLETEGEFLVRESTKIQGQFALSGIAQGGAQHLLMDRAGKVYTYMYYV